MSQGISAQKRPEELREQAARARSDGAAHEAQAGAWEAGAAEGRVIPTALRTGTYDLVPHPNYTFVGRFQLAVSLGFTGLAAYKGAFDVAAMFAAFIPIWVYCLLVNTAHLTQMTLTESGFTARTWPVSKTIRWNDIETVHILGDGRSLALHAQLRDGRTKRIGLTLWQHSHPYPWAAHLLDHLDTHGTLISDADRTTLLRALRGC